jgi:alanyl-tRNA synthetase
MDRLYYNDSYLREFDARVTAVENEGRTIYLDRTAFYPSSGGQPNDLGTLGGVAVDDVVDEGERIAHRLAAPMNSAEVRGVVDWTRRFDHMQQHTGQHLLSAVLAERFGSPTVSFHLGSAVSTIDVKAKGLTPERLADVERVANDEVLANRPVAVSYEDASAAAGLRKESDREGTLRIVTIDGLDRSACGGTHVRSTAEVGLVLLGRTEKVRDTLRIEFVCGGRALRRARRDYDSLAKMAKLFSSTLEDVPSLVERLHGRVADAEKSVRRMAGELAEGRGRAAFASASASADGLRFLHHAAESIDDEVRAEAKGFVSQGSGVFLATGRTPAAVFLACSEASGQDAGALLKEVLAQFGGRGGGTRASAQGSLPSAEVIAELSVAVGRRLGVE